MTRETADRLAPSLPPADCDDLTVVRWYECGRKENRFDDWDACCADMTRVQVATGQPLGPYRCPWGDADDDPHYHYGKGGGSRRGAGRRISNARYHLAQTRIHIEELAHAVN